MQAPEVVYGIPGAVSPPADVYSFGVLLWQLCTGSDPALERKRMLRSVLYRQTECSVSLLYCCLAHVLPYFLPEHGTWDTAVMPAYNNGVLYSAVPGGASSAHRQWQTSYCSAWTGIQTPGRLQVAIALAVAVVCISELFWTRHWYRHPSEGRVVSAHY
jgi:serine/threonine protein kinase